MLLAEDYEWGASDYLQIPLALIIGALHALPTSSFGYKCSKNTTSARNSLLEAFEYFKTNETFFDGMQSIYDMFSYFDEIGSFCYWTVVTELTEAHFTKLFTDWWEIPVNLLYNLGYMWTDLINYCFYTPNTVP